MKNGTLKKSRLPQAFETLLSRFRIVGPKIESGVIVLNEIGFRDIPAGCRDSQEPGSYKLLPERDTQLFSFSPGPDSFKRFLHPPVTELFSFNKTASSISISPVFHNKKPLALWGIRACDLSALKLYDRIFLEGPVKDNTYESLRRNSMVIAMNCLYPGDNCFCLSLGTGPEAKEGFDILVTELENSFFLEAGSAGGKEIMELLGLEPARNNEHEEKRDRIEKCKQNFRKSIRANELPGLIYRSLDHPHWEEIAGRDLECGNCTQVCPTCFCNSSYDLLRLRDITVKSYGFSGTRVRKWDSCFSRSFARIHGGNFRMSRKARFRHWMAHKLAYMQDQFSLPGCVGCGRCITWCPAGIDITVELEALRDGR